MLVQVLVASRNRVTALPSSLHLPFLRELWLGVNRLSAVAAWPWLPSLQLLQLEDNQLAQLAPMQAGSCCLHSCLGGLCMWASRVWASAACSTILSLRVWRR